MIQRCVVSKLLVRRCLQKSGHSGFGSWHRHEILTSGSCVCGLSFTICKMGGELEISALWCKTLVPPVEQWVENPILSVWGPGQRSLRGARGRCEGLWLGIPTLCFLPGLGVHPCNVHSGGDLVLCDPIGPFWASGTSLSVSHFTFLF